MGGLWRSLDQSECAHEEGLMQEGGEHCRLLENQALMMYPAKVEREAYVVVEISNTFVIFSTCTHVYISCSVGYENVGRGFCDDLGRCVKPF